MNALETTFGNNQMVTTACDRCGRLFDRAFAYQTDKTWAQGRPIAGDRGSMLNHVIINVRGEWLCSTCFRIVKGEITSDHEADEQIAAAAGSHA